MSDKYTSAQYLQLLKVVHCLDLEEFIVMKGFSGAKGGQRDYMERKYQQMKEDLFNWLCEQDEEQLALVFNYAEKKCIVTKLGQTNGQ